MPVALPLDCKSKSPQTKGLTVEQDLDIRHWDVADSCDLYQLDSWGKGYFSVADDGSLLVHPTKEPQRTINLKQLVERLELRGLSLPILIRFADILNHRLAEIHSAFSTAIEEHGYQADYRCVYPVKVNQQRHVVEEFLKFGRRFHYGLEAGSKSELLAVIAIADNDTPIVCNGFKDAEFIEAAMLAQKIGRNIIPIVEKYSELEMILHYAEKHEIRPQIGMRVKLASRGSGRWQDSGGHRSKFGLSVNEVLHAYQTLQDREMADCFRLLHFHLGSQITNIRHIKSALIEAARIYAELVTAGAALEYLDVGGGLAVDYDGSQTNFDSSANYTLQEYANDVIYHVQTVCDEANVPHPTIISESGRAIVAYHSALIFSVLGVTKKGAHDAALEGTPEVVNQDTIPKNAEQPLVDLFETHQNLSMDNLLESFHDAMQSFDMAMQLFSGGYLPLEQRCQAEDLYWAICQEVNRLASSLEFAPEELKDLEAQLSDIYFCNFSLFQSMPDSWAIKQLFPVIPIHRLDEQPTRQAVLSDITCDSDGKIDRFISRGQVQRTLPLHPLRDEPYYLGAFLIGAYQEILGDMHNLFGDTNAVHVSLDDSGSVIVDAMIKGDTVREVLEYVQFDQRELLRRMQEAVDVAVRHGQIDYQQAGYILRFYEEGLAGYTYLEQPPG